MPVHNFFITNTINYLHAVLWANNSRTLRPCPVDALWIKKVADFFHRLSTLSCQSSQQIQIVIIHTFFGFTQGLNSSATMQHSRVIAPTKSITNLRQTMIG